MITGSVTARRAATVSLEVGDDAGHRVVITAVIDTGFTGWLTLPPSVISSLSLPHIGARRATLADGSVVDMNLYEATVIWDGQSVDVFVLEGGGGPLIGMSLLYGYTLTIQVIDGGGVSIDILP